MLGVWGTSVDIKGESYWSFSYEGWKKSTRIKDYYSFCGELPLL